MGSGPLSGLFSRVATLDFSEPLEPSPAVFLPHTAVSAGQAASAQRLCVWAPLPGCCFTSWAAPGSPASVVVQPTLSTGDTKGETLPWDQPGSPAWLSSLGCAAPPSRVVDAVPCEWVAPCVCAQGSAPSFPGPLLPRRAAPLHLPRLVQAHAGL